MADSFRNRNPQAGADAAVQLIGRALAAQAEEMRRVVNAVTSSIRIATPSLVEGFRQLDKRLLKAAPAANRLGKAGWTFPMWAPVPSIEETLESLLDSDIDRSFEAFYVAKRHAHAKELFRGLDSTRALAPWQPVLSECIASYSARRYLVAIPALFAVFEGALKAAAQQTNSDLKGAASRRRAAAKSGLDLLIWSSLEGFVATSFETRTPRQPTRATAANRHLVMHGHMLSSNARVDCLRLFQAIDTVQSQISSRRAA